MQSADYRTAADLAAIERAAEALATAAARAESDKGRRLAVIRAVFAMAAVGLAEARREDCGPF